MNLCDDGNILSNKDIFLNISTLLDVEDKTCDEIPNSGWNMADMETEERKIMRSKQIFKAISEKITYLIRTENPTVHKENGV